LFSLWNGRSPDDDEWPKPRLSPKDGFYVWQEPEIALLGSLVGRLSLNQIAGVLTKRLRKLTGDQKAERNVQAVQVRLTRLGMQTRHVLGGITVADAGREVGSVALVQNLITTGVVKTVRVGRLHVIPHETWAAWKASRESVPAGYVALSTIRVPLGVKSDKLSEFARMGYVPSAIQIKPLGSGRDAAVFGRWYLPAEAAEKLLADRRAGRAMPWHSKALETNLRKSFARWSERKHPPSCPECSKIWGQSGAPRSFDDFSARYVPLSHGAKRHLTRPWSPGLKIQEVADKHGCLPTRVSAAIKAGYLAANKHGRSWFVSQTDATVWASRGFQVADDQQRKISFAGATKLFGFSAKDLRGFVRDGTLNSWIGEAGAMRGIRYLDRGQVGRLREKVGFTDGQAAARLDVPVATLRLMAKGMARRKDGRLSAAHVRDLLAMKNADRGLTIEEAARKLRRSPEWVDRRVAEGAVRLCRPRWDGDPPTLSKVMVERLSALRGNLDKPEEPPKGWLRVGSAAQVAGVTQTTINRWGEDGLVERRHVKSSWYYKPSSVRAQARSYWKTTRRFVDLKPAWIVDGRIRSKQFSEPLYEDRTR
jgi:hypothetical protein